MKSHITMYKLVKEVAEKAGIRAHESRFGILATSDEIKEVYARERFVVTPGRTVFKRHISCWEYAGLGWSYGMNMKSDDPFVVFFPMSASDRMRIPFFVERNPQYRQENAIVDIDISGPIMADRDELRELHEDSYESFQQWQRRRGL